MQGPFLRKYGVQTTIDFTLYALTGATLKTDAAHASGDTRIMKDEGDEANTTNGFTDEGQTYSIVLTATEMEAARVVLIIVDQSSPQVWLDTTIVIDTYGHASAQHPFDLGTASTAQTGDAYAQLGMPAGASLSADVAAVKSDTAAILEDTGTTLPAVLAVIDDFLDTEIAAILADTGELQTDWANGGRLDTLLDAASTPSAAAIADAVWDELLSGHTTGGSAGAALNDAGGGTLTLSSAAMNQIADHILRRSFASASASADGDTKTFRSLLGAVAKLVNRIAAGGGTLTVYEADDTTALGAQAITTSESANTIIELNTN